MQVQNLHRTARVSAYQTSQASTNKQSEKKTNEHNTHDVNQQTPSVTYEKSKTSKKSVSYDKKVQKEVYLKRALEMKAQSEQRMVELFGKFSLDGTKEQAHGIKNILSKFFNDTSTDKATLNPSDINDAKDSISEGGYYSAEKTSDRFIEFAKNISHNNPELADKLIDAFKKGYAQAEKMWGGELPEISQKTYDLTIEKFNNWKNGTEDEQTKQKEIS